MIGITQGPSWGGWCAKISWGAPRPGGGSVGFFSSTEGHQSSTVVFFDLLGGWLRGRRDGQRGLAITHVLASLKRATIVAVTAVGYFPDRDKWQQRNKWLTCDQAAMGSSFNPAPLTSTRRVVFLDPTKLSPLLSLRTPIIFWCYAEENSARFDSLDIKYAPRSPSFHSVST